MRMMRNTFPELFCLSVAAIAFCSNVHTASSLKFESSLRNQAAFVHGNTPFLHQSPPSTVRNLGRSKMGTIPLKRVGTSPSLWRTEPFGKRSYSVICKTNALSAVGAEEGGPPSFILEPRKILPAERYTSNDWMLNLLTTFQAPTMKKISNHLIANTLFAIVVYIGYILYPMQAKYLVKGLSPIPHSLLASALGLLLVFRTNSAYDRFWESRKIWGNVITRLRILSQLAHRSLTGLEREHMLRLLSALAPVLLNHLKGRVSDMKELEKLTGPEDAKILYGSNHRPLLVTKMIGGIIMQAFRNPRRLPFWVGKSKNMSNMNSAEVAIMQAEITTQRQLADQHMSELIASIGAAERIVKTTVPVSYSRHTSRFLTVWCFTLPIVLVEPLGWRMIFIVIVTCWAFFTIEEVGHIIEDPFNLPPQHADDMKLERSFLGIREDIMERLPAFSPELLVNGGDVLVRGKYSHETFHASFENRLKSEVETWPLVPIINPPNAT